MTGKFKSCCNIQSNPLPPFAFSYNDHGIGDGKDITRMEAANEGFQQYMFKAARKVQLRIGQGEEEEPEKPEKKPKKPKKPKKVNTRTKKKEKKN